MPKLAGQKEKLIRLARILETSTDEEHPMTINELIAALKAEGVEAERKSLYNDLETLEYLGYDVCKVRSKSVGYYIGSRLFQLPELKLLVDAVQSSRFITSKKSDELIRKLESLTSRYHAKELSRQVYVTGRVKAMNESVYYAIDALHSAIAADRQITFSYYRWNLDKEQVLRRNEPYLVSPFALLWDDENYYLVAFDQTERAIRHFRVDKMRAIRALDAPREGKEAFDAIDVSAYTKQVFGMFGGTRESVTLRFHENLIGVVLDRFGKELPVLREGEDHFTVTVKVAQSPLFFGWLSYFGADAELLSPENCRKAYQKHLKSALEANR